MNEIIVAIITGGITLVGVLLANQKTQAVMETRIDADTREAYRAYRQALRDVPQQDGFPDTIIWPTRPVTGSGGAK